MMTLLAQHNPPDHTRYHFGDTLDSLDFREHGQWNRYVSAKLIARYVQVSAVLNRLLGLELDTLRNPQRCHVWEQNSHQRDSGHHATQRVQKKRGNAGASNLKESAHLSSLFDEPHYSEIANAAG
jgi:hypothetical protein